MLDPKMLAKLNRSIPRYTSYPTAPVWGPISEEIYRDKLDQCQEASLYIHIPFCQTMCLYCGCSVVLNRKPENEERYVNALLREIDLVGKHIPVPQLHFGGGTPTKLSNEQLSRIMKKLGDTFSLTGEIAMEIDPRTVDSEKFLHLKELGFNRVSFGVQDTDPKVQEAVRRRQSREMTIKTFQLARNLGFDHINIDLIYGLPYQTQETFERTISDIIALRPNRIALFSYAKVPHLKPHQKAIKESSLPTTEEKFVIYIQAREQLIEAGYVAIGMDHFCLPGDPIAIKRHRNFQGYTTNPCPDLIGLGITAIGEVGNAYFQNVKTLKEYYAAIDESRLPTHRGHILSEEDIMRRFVIHRLMCDFHLNKQQFADKFGRDFDATFSQEIASYNQEAEVIGELSELFIRNLASHFDAYYKPTQTFSRAV